MAMGFVLEDDNEPEESPEVRHGVAIEVHAPVVTFTAEQVAALIKALF